MALMLAGLSLFFLVHLATATPPVRRQIVQMTGENAWRGLVALGAIGGLLMLGYGWHEAPNEQLFPPSTTAIRLAPLLVSIALILFVIGGGNLPGHIKRRLHHPMLVGVILWAGTHLLANGGLRETLLFASFLIFAVYALVVLLAVGKRATFKPVLKWDIIGILIGLFVATGVMHGHKWLFGVAAI